MTTVTANTELGFYESMRHEQRLISHRVTRYAVPLGRALFASIFVLAVPSHFSPAAIAYARSQEVPLPSVLLPMLGVLALIGGLSILLGFKTRFGAFLLVVFLLATTLMLHRFWSISDPQLEQAQRITFMKNVSMLGCALFLTHVGAGPISLDARRFKIRSEAPLALRRG